MLLQTVRPWLCVKARQADLVLEFIEDREASRFHSKASDHQIALMAKVKALNTKGKNPQRLYA